MKELLAFELLGGEQSRLVLKLVYKLVTRDLRVAEDITVLPFHGRHQTQESIGCFARGLEQAIHAIGTMLDQHVERANIVEVNADTATAPRQRNANRAEDRHTVAPVARASRAARPHPPEGGSFKFRKLLKTPSREAQQNLILPKRAAP